MAPQQSDTGDLSETVSREAHQRVTRERDAAATKAAELEAVVKDLGLREKAIDFFRGKGVDDPVHWATVALPHLREVGVEGAPDRLTELFGSLPTVAPPPAPTERPVNQPPSAFGSERRPNPAAEGAQPRLEPIKPGSTEWKRVLKEEGLEGMRRLDKEGRIAWSDDNLKAQGMRR